MGDAWGCAASRRGVVLALGAGAVSTLVGCDAAGDDPPSATPTASAGARPADAIVAAAEVPVGGGLVVDGRILVVQTRAGEFRAYDARCTHMAGTVSPPDASGTVVCPLHGARYRATDGAVVGGPAPRPLTAVPITVAGGYIRRR